jgi:hypothetical protein
MLGNSKQYPDKLEKVKLIRKRQKWNMRSLMESKKYVSPSPIPML